MAVDSPAKLRVAPAYRPTELEDAGHRSRRAVALQPRPGVSRRAVPGGGRGLRRIRRVARHPTARQSSGHARATDGRKPSPLGAAALQEAVR